MFLMVLSSDHTSPATGLVPVVTLSKAGAAFGAAGGTVTEVSSGWYKIALTTTDTNTLGELAFHVAVATADNTDFTDQVYAYDPTAAQLPANVTQWNGTNVASPATAGIPDVNVKNYNNVVAQTDANSLPKVDVEDVNGSSTVETGITVKQALQYCASALAGVLAGAGTTTVTIAAINNSGTNRITATVDVNGNRSAVTLA